MSVATMLESVFTDAVWRYRESTDGDTNCATEGSSGGAADGLKPKAASESDAVVCGIVEALGAATDGLGKACGVSAAATCVGDGAGAG